MRGGGIQGAAYLNCKEGFEHYAKDGNNLIEIDFLYTSDNEIVCAHEFEKFKGYSLNKRPDFATFENTLIDGEYHGMTYTWLLDKLEEYPEVKIVFDTKEKEAEKILGEMIEIANEKSFDILNRFIVQVYSKENYNYIKETLPHFNEYWFTNYKRGYTFEQILSNFENLDDVTTYVMWDKIWWIYSMSAKNTKKQIALHSVNNDKEIDFYFAHGVDLIYTDFI